MSGRSFTDPGVALPPSQRPPSIADPDPTPPKKRPTVYRVVRPRRVRDPKTGECTVVDEPTGAYFMPQEMGEQFVNPDRRAKRQRQRKEGLSSRQLRKRCRAERRAERLKAKAGDA